MKVIDMDKFLAKVLDDNYEWYDSDKVLNTIYSCIVGEIVNDKIRFYGGAEVE